MIKLYFHFSYFSINREHFQWLLHYKFTKENSLKMDIRKLLISFDQKRAFKFKDVKFSLEKKLQNSSKIQNKLLNFKLALEKVPESFGVVESFLKSKLSF